MSDSESIIINLGELSKPATVLIEKLSDAVEGVFKPYQIKQIARAEAEANLIAAESQIQITDLKRRARHRWEEEEFRRQSNMESITSGSLPLLEDHSKPEALDNDWIVNFFDKCRIVSDSQMQRLWSRVLAGQANNPGTFSRRTINLISDLEKADAEQFTTLCRFGWTFGSTAIAPLIYDSQDVIYNDHGVDFGSLSHLESLGLIQFNSLSGFRIGKLPKVFDAEYFGTRIHLTMPKDEDNSLAIGQAMLTNAGMQLATICGAQPVPEFIEYVRQQWAKKQVISEVENNE
jgi:hypothetical protein